MLQTLQCAESRRKAGGMTARKRTWTNPSDGAKHINPHDVKVTVSWWTAYCQPEQRDHFIEAAKVRTAERDHQSNVRESKRAVRF